LVSEDEEAAMAIFNPAPIPRPIRAVSARGGDGQTATAAAQYSVVPKHGVADSRPVQGRYLVAAYALIAVGAIGGWLIYEYRDPVPPVVVSGLGVFAAFYVVAQGLERVLEPFQDRSGAILGGVKTPKLDICAGENQAGQAAHEDSENVWRKSELKTRRAHAITTALCGASRSPQPTVPSESQVADAARVAAETQAAVQQYRRNSTAFMWGLSSAMAILVSAAVGLALMHSVGVQDAPVLLDIIITGIIIGSGSKPLHDLISSIQVSKDSKKDPDQVTSS
jgi:hypothetical protein